MVEKFIPLFVKLIKTISLNKIFIWCITAIVLITAYTAFEKRAVLAQFIFGKEPEVVLDKPAFSISEASKTSVRSLVSNEENLLAIIILSTNIRNNQRAPAFWFSDDVQIQRSLDFLYLEKSVKIPLFSSDQKNNEEIVSVINGEFTCTAFDDAINKSIFPNLGSRFPYICRASLPPYYGQFSGYMAFALNSPPDSTSLDRIKSEAISIATEIYFRDILTHKLAQL